MAISGAFINGATDTANASSYNFGSFSLGSAGMIVVVAEARASGNISVSSVTVDGASATIVSDNSNPSAVQNPVCIAVKEVSDGSRTVVVNYSSTALRAACQVYLVTGYASTTPSDTDSGYSAASPTSLTATLSFPANGFAIYGHLHGNTGLASFSAATEDYEAQIESLVDVSSGSKTGSSDPDTETVSWSTGANYGYAAAVWAPAAASSGAPHYYYQQQAAAV